MSSQPRPNEPNWPPRSPHEALLSTPGGRDRLRRLAERASPSPSPIKRSTSTPSLRDQGSERLKLDLGLDDDEDEDEETLQLQLQEIQARLKLKKLQKRAAQNSDTENDINRTGSAPLSLASAVAGRISGLREKQLQKSESQSSVHVPVSPVRRTQQPSDKSPHRILLGIDKGLKGSDITLKRAPSLRKAHDAATRGPNLAGPFLQRPASQASTRASGLGAVPQSSAEDRSKSFNERMAAMRAKDEERHEREIRIKKHRSTAFDIDQQKIQSFKESAVELPELPRPAPAFSRDEVLDSYNKPGGNLPRSNTAPNLRSAMRRVGNTSESTSVSNRSESQASTETVMKKRTTTKSKTQPSDVTESEASQFEPYSSIHLSKRIVPHKELTRTLTGKKTFVIPDLLRTVKGPDFSGPDIEEDVVVFGIISQKSAPRSHAANSKNEGRGKYMIMSLTDLKWELDLFLFDSAFIKFWKLTVGTIVAILNPTFMPPPPGRAATGKFSLALNSNADTLLEIGTARDLGFCKSVKKDGKTCDSWVDKRHTEFCDFHVNEALKKTRVNRMEVNSMSFGPSGLARFNSRDMTGYLDRLRQTEESKKTRYDRESHSQIFIGKSTVNLLDDPDFHPDAFHRGTTREERLTRRILEQEKERELARKLGVEGGGLGAAYMRRRETPQQQQPLDVSSGDAAVEAQPDAAALGLLKDKAKDVQLSPVNKRKRANTASSSSAAVGWGGNLAKELARMRNGENLQPVKKKTRFVTEKGIREAGRDSFGGDAVRALVNDLDDDDDDLVIVRE